MRKTYIIVLALVGVAFFILNQTPDQPVVILFDSLSPSGTQELTQLLTDGGYSVQSYVDENANVNNFKKIPSGSELVIFRVHSSINQGKVWLFTGEPYSHENHAVEQLVDSVHRARANSTAEYYFATSTNFFMDNLPELCGSNILVLGCDAAASNDLAEVFLEKGASSFVSWDGPVSLEHTDLVFKGIITQYVHGVDIQTAVEESINQYGADPCFKSNIICIKQ